MGTQDSSELWSAWWFALGRTPIEVRARLLGLFREFYRVASQDLLIGFFFEKKDLERIALQQSHFTFQSLRRLCFASLPEDIRTELTFSEPYTGKAPFQAHEELAPILEGHFDRRLRLLEQTLAREGIPPAVIQTWIRFEESFRQAIVSRQ